MATAKKLPSGSWRCQVLSHTEEYTKPDGTIGKRKSLENSRLLECRWPDSNRHGFPLDFESSASANSATAANEPRIILP